MTLTDLRNEILRYYNLNGTYPEFWKVKYEDWLCMKNEIEKTPLYKTGPFFESEWQEPVFLFMGVRVMGCAL